METQILGQVITQDSVGFWMPRGGDEATYSVDVAHISGGTWTFEIQTKTSEQSDTAAAASPLGSTTFTTTGVQSVKISGAKDWVRMIVKPGSEGGYVHVKLLSPQWTPN